MRISYVVDDFYEFTGVINIDFLAQRAYYIIYFYNTRRLHAVRFPFFKWQLEIYTVFGDN